MKILLERHKINLQIIDDGTIDTVVYSWQGNPKH